MIWLRWSFLAFNVFACIAVLLSDERGRPLISRLISPESGVSGVFDTAGWIYVWQLVGVGLVIWLHLSAWHLFWWFVLGWMVVVLVGKLLMRIRSRS